MFNVCFILCLLFDSWCLMVVVCGSFVVRRLSFCGCWLLSVDCRLLFVVYCLLFNVYCSLFVVRCLFLMLFVI